MLKMAKEITQKTNPVFEQLKQIDANGNEFWTARMLAKTLDYTDFRNFISVIEKAKEACLNSGQLPENHLVEFNEMVTIGSGAKRQLPSYKLSRYACYLIVQNADPSKEVVALGQTYFTVQTRLQEISQMDAYNRLTGENEKRLFLRNELAQHNIQLASAEKRRRRNYTFRLCHFSKHGYMGLYGGLDAKAIHKHKNLQKSEQILDHMGSTELAANLFRATQTEEKLKRENIKGKQKANETHFEVGKKVRSTIQELGGIMPESLPAAVSIKKIEKQQQAKLLKVKKKDK